MACFTSVSTACSLLGVWPRQPHERGLGGRADPRIAAGRQSGRQQQRYRFRDPQVGEDLDRLDLHFRAGPGEDCHHRPGRLGTHLDQGRAGGGTVRSLPAAGKGGDQGLDAGAAGVSQAGYRLCAGVLGGVLQLLDQPGQTLRVLKLPVIGRHDRIGQLPGLGNKLFL